MSRYATAARSSSRTHSVDSRASQPPQRLGDAGRDLGGLAATEPWAGQQPGQLLTKNGLPPLRCHSPAVTWAGTLVPASYLGQRPDVVRREAGEDELLGLARRPRAAAPDASVSRYGAEQRHGFAPSGRGPGSSAAAATARRPSARSSSTHEHRVALAARRPRHRDTASNKRNWASAAAAALISWPPRRRRAAAASPPRRARPPANPAGLQHL